MSDKDVLEELENIKKSQERLNKKITSLEAKLGGEDASDDEPVILDDEKPSQNNPGIPLIVIGILLSFTVIGLVIGIPLIIAGIYKLVSAPKQSKQESGEPAHASKPATKASNTSPKTKELSFKEKQEIQKDTILKWLGRAGITLTVIGVAFFIRYAIELGYLGFGARLVLAGLLGAGLIGLGYKLKNKSKYAVLSQFLSTGGFVILYFTAFSSYFFEDYREAISMTFPLASMLLGAIVIGMIFYMIRFGSLATTSLAYLLGYFTVILGRGDSSISMVYLGFLTLSALYLAYDKNWQLFSGGITLATYLFSVIALSFGRFDSLEFVFLTAMFVLIHVFSEFYLKKDQYIITKSLNNVLYATSVSYYLFNNQYIEYFFFILASALFLSYLISSKGESKYSDLIGSIIAIVVYSLMDLTGILITALWGALAIFNMFVYLNNKEIIFRIAAYFFSAIMFVKNLTWDLLFYTDEFFNGLVQESTVLIALSIITFAIIVYIRNDLADRNVFSTGALVLVAAALFVELSTLNLVIAFILASVALRATLNTSFIIAVKTGSYAFLGVAIIRGLDLVDRASSELIVSYEAIAVFFAIATILTYAYTETNAVLSKILGYGGFALYLLTVSLEFSNFAITMICGVSGLILLTTGMYLGKDGVRNAGLIALMISVLKLFVIDTLELDILLRTIAYISLGVTLLVAAFIFSKYKDKFNT